MKFLRSFSSLRSSLSRPSCRSRTRAAKRQLLVESLDQRMLMAADLLASQYDATIASPPLPASHALYASDSLHRHDHDHHEDEHDHADESSLHSDSMYASGLTHDHFGVRDASGSESAAARNDNGMWDQPGGIGSAVTITYSYAGLLDGNLTGSLSADQLRSAVEESLALWASYAPLNFVELEDAGPPIFVNGQDNTSYRSTGTPDIRIGHHDIDQNGNTLAYAYYPSTNYWGVSGDIHFDTSENWRLGRGAFNGTDFLEVMTHEVGHALGLDHEDDADAIMNPFVANRYTGLGTSYLLTHDIDAIRNLYGSGEGSVTPIIYNDAPVVDAIADQNVSVDDGNFSILVNASDTDGDTLTYQATAVQVDPLENDAYQLKQTYGFRAASNDGYNYRGQGEKYFYGEGSRWFFMLPDGDIHRWNGSIASSPQVAQLDGSFHQQLSRLTAAQAPEVTNVSIDATWNGSELTVGIDGNTPDSFVIQVDVSDQYETTSETFTVSIADTAPTIAPIADQNAGVNDGSLTLTIDAVDPEGRPLDLQATASSVDAGAVAAFELKQRHNFRAARNDGYNYRGQGEKYFYGEGSRWFFILPNGSVHRWSGSINSSPAVGEVDPSYHAELDTLMQLAQPQATELSVDLNWIGNELTIDWNDSFVGSFGVTVFASDARFTTETTFAVNVSNTAPLIESIADQSLSVRDGSITIPVAASDADGDTLLLSATAQQIDADSVAAFDLKTQYGLRSAGREAYNYRGQGEKYFYGQGTRWFFILPDGGVYRWAGSIGSSTQIGQVATSYHQDLDSLLNATKPTTAAFDGTVSWSGNDLTIDVPPQFVGRFFVTVTANDGAESVETTFAVEVANQAPVLDSIADQSFANGQGFDNGQGTLVVPVQASDADGDTIAYTAVASTIDQLQVDAYALKQQHGLYATAESYNYRGYGEKYFRGHGGAWHFILPDGGVYRWTGSIPASTQIGQLDASYHAELRQLTQATAPVAQTLDATLSWSGDELSITRPTNFTGTFTVTVSVTDGAETVTKSFNVTVGASASSKASLTATTRSIEASLDAIDALMSQLAR